jgi:hypothetical protein
MFGERVDMLAFDVRGKQLHHNYDGMIRLGMQKPRKMVKCPSKEARPEQERKKNIHATLQR